MGVEATLFVRALVLLVRCHGERYATPEFVNLLADRLGDVERAYLALELVQPEGKDAGVADD